MYSFAGLFQENAINHYSSLHFDITPAELSEALSCHVRIIIVKSALVMKGLVPALGDWDAACIVIDDIPRV